jgi:hypothetical protein
MKTPKAEAYQDHPRRVVEYPPQMVSITSRMGWFRR